MQIRNNKSISIPKTKMWQRLIVSLAVIFVGAGILIASQAATGTLGTSIQPEDGAKSVVEVVKSADASNGMAIQFGTIKSKRFFSDDASWNKTVTELGGRNAFLNGDLAASNPTSRDYAKILWDYGGGPQYRVDGTVQKTGGGFFPQFKNFSVPIYDAAEQKTTAKAFEAVWAQNASLWANGSNGYGNLAIGSTLPWDPAWRAGGYSDSSNQTDRDLVIVNYQTGEVHELWRAEEPKASCYDNLDLFGLVIPGNNGKAGYNQNDSTHLCMAGIHKYSNLWTAKEGSTTSNRGMGINQLALIARAREVQSGAIRHALSLVVSNPMFGPTLAASYQEDGAGTTKGFFLSPATRLEHLNPATLNLGGVTTAPVTNEERAKTSPSGMRFALNITSTQIDQWLSTKTSWSTAKKSTAKIFANALRDYGAIIAETGGNGIGVEMDGIQGPDRDLWASLGIVDESPTNFYPAADLFDGLITRDRLYVVNPPQ